MNMQAMMKQVQQLQKEMLKQKEEIDQTVYTGKSNFVDVEIYGNKKIKQINIDKTQVSNVDDIEMIEDLLMVSINEAMDKIDQDTEKKLGKYTKGMPGLF